MYKIKHNNSFKSALLLLIEIALFVYAFSLPSFGEKTSFVHYIIYGAMVFLGTTVILYCSLYRPIKINVLFFILLPFVLFSFFGTAFYSRNFRNWITVCLLFFSFIIFLYAFAIIGKLDKVFIVISLGFFAFSLYYIFHYRYEILSFAFVKKGRMGSFFDNENAVSLYSLIGFTIPFYIVLFTKSKFRFLYLIPCLTSFIVGVTTGSRTFYLLLAVVIFIYLFFLFRKHKFIYLIVLAICIALFFGLLSMPFMGTIRERLLSALETIFGTSDRPDTSTIQRVVYIDYGFYFGTKHLFLGLGCGGFSVFSGTNTYSHCNYSEMICDFGIIGFLLFYIPLFLPLIFSYKYKMQNKQILYVFVLFYLFFGISNVFYSNKIYYLVLGILYYFTFVEGRYSFEKENVFDSINSICIVCDSLKAGGTERVISILANEFSKRGIRVSVVTTSNESKCFYTFCSKVKMLTLYAKGSVIIRFFRKVSMLTKQLRKDRPDIVLSFLPLVNFYCFLACNICNVRYVVSERNNPNTDPQNRFLRFAKEIAFLYADGCVFQTPDAKGYYCESIQNKSEIIPNPISSESIADAMLSKKKTITSVGRLVEQKNYKMLLSAFKKFYFSGHSDYFLNIYGDGPLKEELIDYCKREDIYNAVIFKAPDLKWIDKEKDTSMFVLTSKYEGAPNSLFEALCSGIPCISTDCPIGGPSFYKNEGFELELVSVGDVDGLCKKMVLSLNEAWISRSLSNKRKAISFSDSLIADKWLRFILSIKNQPLF